MSNHLYFGALSFLVAIQLTQSEEEILSPGEDFEQEPVGFYPSQARKRGDLVDHKSTETDPEPCSSRPIDQQSDQTSDIIPLAISPDSDLSDMQGAVISGPSFKAKAPKNGK